MNTIKCLEELIVSNAEAYYSGQDCISDEVFDQYIEELTKLDPNNTLLKSTGWGIKVKGSNKLPHKFGLVEGIDDKVRPEDVCRKIKIWNTSNDMLYIQPKLDGQSILLYYQQGQLQEALTRGDGIYGEDITEKVIKHIPNKLTTEFTGRIRGEFVIQKNKWNQLYAESFKSARNFGAGLLARKNVSHEDLENFNIICYSVEPAEGPLMYHKQLEFLNRNAFYSLKYQAVIKDFSSIEDTEACNNTLYQLNNDLYECDGLVVTYNKYKKFAIKWNVAGVHTKVTNILWQMSRLGRLCPVVEFDPVELSGATIKRASGFNAQFIQETKLGVGSTISIIRSGDVIPHIEKVITPSRCFCIPEVCPSCESKLVTNGVNLVCENQSCPSRGSEALYYFIESAIPVDGLGQKLLEKLFQGFKITTIEQFIHLANTYNSFSLLRFCNSVSGLGKSCFIKFKEVLDTCATSTLNLDQVIIGLGLPSLGEKSVQTVLDYLDYDTLMLQLSRKEIKSIPGTNYLVLQSLYEHETYINSIINSFRNKPVRALKKQSETTIINIGLKICVTGALSVSRRALLEECQSYGIEEVTIAKADILITNETTESSKYKYAIAHNKKIMTEEVFREEYLNDNAAKKPS